MEEVEEEKIYNDLLNYFEENLVSQIAHDLDLSRSTVGRIKHQVKVARAGEAGASIPAQLAKQIRFYVNVIYRNPSE